MAFDIYGNNLRQGFCEVHPHVQQEYPCGICCRAEKENRQQEANWKKQQKDYYKHLELQGQETVRVVIDELIQRIPFTELEKDVIDIDFGGNYLIQIQKQNDDEPNTVYWTVTNAMNGYGHNCFDTFKEHKVHILTN